MACLTKSQGLNIRPPGLLFRMVLDLAILVLHTVNQHVVAISFMDLLPNPCRDTQIRTALGQFGKCMFGFRLVFHGERQLSNVAVQLHFGARYFEKGSGILKNAPTF